MIDYKAADFWLRCAQVVGYVVLGVWVYISNRQKATVSEIKAVQTQLEAMQKAQTKSCGQHLARTVILETTVKSGPSHTDLGLVHDRITSVKGGVDELKGMIKGVTSNVNLLVEHHLRGERG